MVPKKIVASAGIVVAVLFAAGGYGYWNLYNRDIYLEKMLSSLENEKAALQNYSASTTAQLASTTGELAGARNINNSLSQSLTDEQNKNNQFESTIKDISATVSTLQKLSSTDHELLKKYSKVYFLNENYVPASLSAIPPQYLFNTKRAEMLHSGALPYLDAMIEAAKRDGVSLQVVSAFRSFYEQQNVKSSYSVTYGAGTANQFSADQGYSEHQLGTAVDFTSTESKGVFSAFEKSAAYKWLTDNAYKYGFMLSYPKGNVYYIFESWHWRFVGVSLATALRTSGEYFYNMSQTELDKYLLNIFD